MNEVSRRSWYEKWFNSPFYYKLYFERNEEEARAFLHKLIQRIRPEHNSRLIEIGCGRGRQSRMLASLDFDVTAIDLIPDNITLAKEFASEKLQFFIHDIRLPFWINYFDYAFNFFTGFGYFRTRREHDDSMRTIGASLKPGGTFVIDYLNVHFAKDHMVNTETIELGTTTFEIHRWDDEKHFYKKITVSDPSLPQPDTFTEKIARFSLGDFTDMLSFQSLQVQEVFGDYDLNSYDVNKSPRLIIIARKKENEPADKEKRLYSDGRATDALT